MLYAIEFRTLFSGTVGSSKSNCCFFQYHLPNPFVNFSADACRSRHDDSRSVGASVWLAIPVIFVVWSGLVVVFIEERCPDVWFEISNVGLDRPKCQGT